MPLTLKKTEAYAPIREAFDNNRLSAQNPVPTVNGCFYRHPNSGCPCAIGVLIPDDNEIKMNHELNNDPFEILTQKGLIEVDDWQWFCELQHLHDNWQADAISTSLMPRDPEARKAAFLEHLEKAKPNATDHPDQG